MNNAYAIILAGGNGERFWPVSTPERPKQFVSLFGNKALIRHAVDRLEGLIPPSRTIVITSQRFINLTRKTLPMIPTANIIGEPSRRGTAAAVAVACGLVKRLGGESAVGCILTADHLMKPVEKFRQTLKDAVQAAKGNEAIVTLGIKPTYAATGFGYIECGDKLKGKVLHVKRFVEKPDAKTAEAFLKSGKFLWNAGMFIWRASVMEAEFRKCAPDIARVIGLVAEAKIVTSALKKCYATVRDISIDYAVMEKAKSILVVKCDFEWDDVGSWSGLKNQFPADKAGNVVIGPNAMIDVKSSVVVTEKDHLIAALGVKDVVIVHTHNATLVCAKDRVQELKKLLKLIK